jgi:hypothetical protein
MKWPSSLLSLTIASNSRPNYFISSPKGWNGDLRARVSTLMLAAAARYALAPGAAWCCGSPSHARSVWSVTVPQVPSQSIHFADVSAVM